MLRHGPGLRVCDCRVRPDKVHVVFEIDADDRCIGLSSGVSKGLDDEQFYYQIVRRFQLLREYRDGRCPVIRKDFCRAETDDV